MLCHSKCLYLYMFLESVKCVYNIYIFLLNWINEIVKVINYLIDQSISICH